MPEIQAEPENEFEWPEGTPESVASKFKSPADLAKSYAELETKIGGPREDPKPPEPEAPTGEGEAPKSQEEIAEFTGLSQEYLSELSNSFHQNGGLTEEQYAELEGRGLDKGTVDSFIAGQVARLEVLEMKAQQTAGGPEKLKELLDWASKNLEPSQIETLNGDLTSLDANKVTGAVTTLMGLKGNRVMGTNFQGGSDVYGSYEEYQRDVQNPMYKQDPAFRQKVWDKLGRSKNI